MFSLCVAVAAHQAAGVTGGVCGGGEGDQRLSQHGARVLQSSLAGINAAQEALQQLLALAIQHCAGLLLRRRL